MSRPSFSCSVRTEYLAEQSDPTQGVYAYAYTITIVNDGDIAAQLIGRHWQISDATGKTEEVRGLGVVGHQPLLQPGERFEYTSWTRLETPQGRMRGSYFCMTEDANWFEAPVAAFELGRAQALHWLH